MYIQQILLQSFLKRFLPEAKIEKKGSWNELMNIVACIDAVVKLADMKVNTENVFEAFVSSGYPIAVIEPTDIRKPKPYIDTCSHAIYVGIDKTHFKKLNNLMLSLSSKDLTNQHSLALEIIEFLTTKW